MTHRPFRVHARRTVALVAVAGITMAGCGDGSADDAEGGDGEAGRVDIGTLPTANAAPMYLGMREGFFEEEGLDVEPTVLGGGNEIITGLVSGDYDVGFVGYISAGVAMSQNVPVCVVSANDATGTSIDDDWQALVVGEGGEIETPQDLAGATIGINALGGVAEVLIQAGLDADGVDPSSIEFIEVPFPEVPATIEAGRVDAAYAAEPFITTVLDEGGDVVHAPQSALAPEYPNGSYAASEPFVAENADVVERFVRAMDRSVDYARDNEDAVREIIPEYTEIPPEVAEQMRLPAFTSELDEAAIDEQMRFTEDYDVGEGMPTAQELICG